MKTTLLKLVSVISLASALVNIASPVKAFVFNNGDQLEINSNFTNKAANPLDVNFVTDTFGVGVNTKGGFIPFSTNGALNANYKILDVDFSNPASYVGKTFLDATIPGDDFQFIITEPVAPTVFGTTNGVLVIDQLKGKFVSTKPSNQAPAFGFLSGTFIQNSGTFAGTIAVEVVPEPATAVALGAIGAAMLFSRRRQNTEK